MNHEEHVINLLPDVLAGLLSESDVRGVEAHLRVCPECRAEYEDLHRLWALLGQIPHERPAHALRPGFDAMLTAYKEGMNSRTRIRARNASILSRLVRWNPSHPVLQLGFVVAVFVCGALVGGRWAGPARVSPDEGVSLEVATLRGEVQAMNRMLAVSLMQQQSASERLRGVSMSNRVAGSDTQIIQTLFATLNYDTDVNVRLASINALGKFTDDPEVRSGILRSLARQKSPLVQIALIDLLVETQDRQAPAMFAQLARQAGTNKTVRTRLEQALQQIL